MAEGLVPSPDVQSAITTAMELGADADDVKWVVDEVANLFTTAVSGVMNFDPEKVQRLMDLSVIGLMHERGMIP